MKVDKFVGEKPISATNCTNMPTNGNKPIFSAKNSRLQLHTGCTLNKNKWL
jgi:hypothetical protein